MKNRKSLIQNVSQQVAGRLRKKDRRERIVERHIKVERKRNIQTERETERERQSE